MDLSINYKNTQLASLDGSIVKDSQQYPNRLICIVRIKAYPQNSEPKGNWGTGCFINEKYVLTAAHVIQQLKQYFYNQKIRIEGYVRQALNDGKHVGTYKIKPETIRLSASYVNKSGLRYKDYALFQVTPLSEIPKQQKYMPLVAFKKQKEMQNYVESISLYGYPYDLNRSVSEADKPSSLFMQNMTGSKGNFSYQPKQITYELPTQRGVSGGPIIAYLESIKEHIIVGIHKGKKITKEQKQQNCGIIALEMLEEMNEWGYQLMKQPFIYTKQTHFLRNNPKLKQVQILNLMDRYLDVYDINVLVSFELSHIKKIILSGNKLKQEGVRKLLKRKYPHLQSLHLTQNLISQLDAVENSQWQNVSTISTFSLSVNSLKELPQNMLILKKLHTLNICYNDFEQVPNILHSLNSESQQSIKVLIYQTKIKWKDPANIKIKDQIQQKNVNLILNRQQ